MTIYKTDFTPMRHALADHAATIAIHPIRAEELATLKMPEPDPVEHHSVDTGVEWKDVA